MSRVALATCAALPGGPDDETSLAPALAARGLEAEWRVWNDPGVDSGAEDLVLIRSTWDYVDRSCAGGRLASASTGARRGRGR